jgi:hypothetical protein
MATGEARKGAGILGVGAAACAACCAGPILGLLAAAGLLTVAAYITAGIVGLAFAVSAAVWFIRSSRVRRTCDAPAGPTPVELVTRP